MRPGEGSNRYSADAIKRTRRKTREVFYGSVRVGGGAPVSIQSMSTEKAARADAVLKEFGDLKRAGCEIARVSVKDREDIEALPRICAESGMPVIADIHFDYRLAVSAAPMGVAGLRINPGNIGGKERVREVIEAASSAGIPVRVGVNSGSLQRSLRKMYRRNPARALCESAVESLEMIEAMGFEDLVFSIKSSDPLVNARANLLFADKSDYPLHIGVTEAGPVISGSARSTVSLTILLLEGVGDTVRVSLSGDPVNEVVVAAAVLSSLGIRDDIPRVISCPTCGRCKLNVTEIAEALEKEVLSRAGGIRVAVMGCEVNGPGEARDADIGLAGTASGAVLFKKGKKYKVLKGGYLKALLEEIDRMPE